MIRNLLKRLTSKFVWRLEHDSLEMFLSILKNILGYKSDIEWRSDLKLYRICDTYKEIYVARKSRLHLYKNGVSARLDFLLAEYLVDRIKFQDHDIVIDVGANVGEFSKAISSLANVHVLAIEPEPLEYRALQKNLSKIADFEVYNVCLWKESGEIPFFEANDSGDSSIFQPTENSVSTVKSALSLDDLSNTSSSLSKGGPIKLLKLEAEGAEPECIEGACNLLDRVQYIVADVGPERGLSKDNTLLAVQGALSKKGFEPIRFGLPRAVMLFKNLNI